MLWVDYNIEQGANGSFTVRGEWPDEVMGKNQDGSSKVHYLYKPGDVFIVNEAGWLVRVDQLTSMVIGHEHKDEF